MYRLSDNCQQTIAIKTLKRIKEKQSAREIKVGSIPAMSRKKFEILLNWLEVKTNLEIYYLETKNEQAKILLTHFDNYYKVVKNER